MAKHDYFTEEQIAEALRKTHGKVYAAADVLRCGVRTVYDYLGRFPELNELREHYRERFLDGAELKLEEAVIAGEAWAICFSLKTLGRSRGYVERQEFQAQIEHVQPVDRDLQMAIMRDPQVRTLAFQLQRRMTELKAGGNGGGNGNGNGNDGELGPGLPVDNPGRDENAIPGDDGDGAHEGEVEAS